MAKDKFEYSPKLPIELRPTIWSMAHENPLVIGISFDGKPDVLVSSRYLNGPGEICFNQSAPQMSRFWNAPRLPVSTSFNTV